MSTRTRTRQIARDIVETEAAAARERLARAELAAALRERTAPGIAPIEPAALARLFDAAPARAWAALARLSEEQLVNEAIEYTCWLELAGINAQWGQVLDCWRRRLAARAAA